MVVEQIGSAVAGLRAAVDGLLKADLTALSSVELTDLIKVLEVERRRLEPVEPVLPEVSAAVAEGTIRLSMLR